MVLRPYLAASLVAASAALPVKAEIVSASDAGFVVRHDVTLAADPDAIYAALINPSTWWDPAHSYSGDAANFRLSPTAGECFCETVPGGGSVEHLRVVYVQPGRTLRLAGALGPLQPLGVSGAMSWTITPDMPGGSARVVFEYAVGGYAEGGLERWAEPVDGVVSQQLERLKARIDG